MRVVLVNPRHSRRVSAIAQISVGPPLGLAYLAAVLQKEKIDTMIIDANALGLGEDAAAREAAIARPDVVGVTATTPTIFLAGNIASRIKEILPAARIVLGGCHATFLPARTLMEHPSIDAAVIGEAESRIVPIVNALCGRNPPLKDVDGVCFRESGRIVQTGRPPVEDVGEIPWPARRMLPNEKYFTPDSSRMTTILASRGCPAGCTYCAVPAMFGRRMRLRPAQDVVAEMEHCHRDLGVEYFCFLDDTFTSDRIWVEQLCATISASPNRGKWRWSCLTRPDMADREILARMRGAGCCKVEIGVESGSERTLKFLKKGTSVGQARDAFRLAKEAGLGTFAFAMLNIPHETAGEMAMTGKLLMELDPDFIQLSFCTPYPGTELFRYCAENKLFETEEFSEYVFLKNPVIKNENIGRSELLRIRNQIDRRFYLRPSYMVKLGRLVLKGGLDARSAVKASMSGFRTILGRMKPIPAGGAEKPARKPA